MDSRMETMEELDFFQKNEYVVCGRICKILLWMTLVFPALFLCSTLGIFKMTYGDLIPITIIGVICTVSPYILYKKNVKFGFIKNYSMVALALTIGVMSTNPSIGIYLTYPLVVAMSCMYFDKKFTKRAALIAFVCMAGSMVIRTMNSEIVGETKLSWYTGRTVGYTIEFIAMSSVFIAIANHARKVLEKLNLTEHVQVVLEQCGDAAETLATTMTELDENIKQSLDCTEQIAEQAEKTIASCKKNLEKVEGTGESIEKMHEGLEVISATTEEMIHIAENSYQITENYLHIMDEAVEAIKDIDASSEKIKDGMQHVNDCASQISDFTDTVLGISNRTNILALNASIEAARAGEQGKGFAVVAAEVGKLAEECQKATQSITEQVAKMQADVNAAMETVLKNKEQVIQGENAIQSAKNEAGTILELQTKSTEIVHEVQENLQSILESQKTVTAMSQSMGTVTEESLAQAQRIQTAIETQTQAEISMKNVFNKVQEVSNNLLEISNGEEETDNINN